MEKQDYDVIKNERRRNNLWNYSLIKIFLVIRALF